VRASAIARLLDAELEGGADPEVTGAAPLDRAGPEDVSIVAKARYLSYVDASHAGLLLVASDLRDRVPEDRPRIVLGDVHAALTAVLPALYPEPERVAGIHPSAQIGVDAEVGADATLEANVVIGAGARIGAEAWIGAGTVVGPDCVLGDRVRLHPHVTVYRGARIGADTVIHAGSRIGVDGFGYAAVDGVPTKVPQVGDCVIGEHVEIGANVTIDRGSIGTTEIGDHVKIDNLVQIGHNVRIGAGAIIVAQVGIAGSTTVGRGATLGGQAGLSGHLEVGAGATVAAQAGVFGDIPAGEVWSGYPARPHDEALRAQAGLFRLSKLMKRVRALEQRTEGRKTEE
jgi:UDP-3-O-[3-hydroxymyristoyl] glucosamine N-acyltransferase